MFDLRMFGFSALWSPKLFAILLLILCLYFILIGPLRKRFSQDGETSLKQKIYFTIGIIIIYIAQGSPIDLIGHIIFTAHMFEMALLNLVAPIYIILGIPNWLWRSILSNKYIDKVFTFFTKPLLAMLLFNGVFSLYHYPVVFDHVKANPINHIIFTNVLFLMAIFMWFPVLSNLQERQILSDIQKIGYIFGNGILLTPACGLIIFGGHPFYATYTDPALWTKSMELCVSPGILKSLHLSGPEALNIMTAAEDQQVGGIVMKIIQEIVYGFVMGYNFFKWAKREKNGSKIDPITQNPYASKMNGVLNE